MKIEITRMMTMIAACCFSSVLVLLTAETTFFCRVPLGTLKIKKRSKNGLNMYSNAIAIYYNPKAYEITASLYFEAPTLSFDFKDFSPESL